VLALQAFLHCIALRGVDGTGRFLYQDSIE